MSPIWHPSFELEWLVHSIPFAFSWVCSFVSAYSTTTSSRWQTFSLPPCKPHTYYSWTHLPLRRRNQCFGIFAYFFLIVWFCWWCQVNIHLLSFPCVTPVLRWWAVRHHCFQAFWAGPASSWEPVFCARGWFEPNFATMGASSFTASDTFDLSCSIKKLNSNKILESSFRYLLAYDLRWASQAVPNLPAISISAQKVAPLNSFAIWATYQLANR